MTVKAIIGVFCSWVVVCVVAVHAFYAALSDAKETTSEACRVAGFEKFLNEASSLKFSVTCSEDPYLAAVDCKVTSIGIKCVLRCGEYENFREQRWRVADAP